MDAYRTLCIAPSPDIRAVLKNINTFFSVTYAEWYRQLVANATLDAQTPEVCVNSWPILKPSVPVAMYLIINCQRWATKATPDTRRSGSSLLGSAFSRRRIKQHPYSGLRTRRTTHACPSHLRKDWCSLDLRMRWEWESSLLFWRSFPHRPADSNRESPTGYQFHANWIGSQKTSHSFFKILSGVEVVRSSKFQARSVAIGSRKGFWKRSEYRPLSEANLTAHIQQKKRIINS